MESTLGKKHISNIHADVTSSGISLEHNRLLFSSGYHIAFNANLVLNLVYIRHNLKLMLCLQKYFQTLNTLTVSSTNMTSKTEEKSMPGING